jgi:hypothetical protein
MMKSEVISRLLEAGQRNGARVVSVDTASGPISAGDAPLVAAMAVERKLKAQTAAIPDDVDLTKAHFGEISAALMRSVNQVAPPTRAVLAMHGIDNQMQLRLKGLELAHAVDGPGFMEKAAAVLARLKERLPF